MWTFLVRPECILCLSSVLIVMAQLNPGQSPRINQTHLNPNNLNPRRYGPEVWGGRFYLEGSPFRILSGTMHYFRVPKKYWGNSLMKMKACGFNTVTTHVPWNLHEPMERKLLDFHGNLDLMAFLTMASQVGLWVILCPGPYIGSDVDLGGLPSWLFKYWHMKLRSTSSDFVSGMSNYFTRLIPKIKPFQYMNGGPIIAMQLENDYGSFGKERHYMDYIRVGLRRRGIKVPLMTAERDVDYHLASYGDTMFAVHTNKMQSETYARLVSIREHTPLMMIVYTSSSFDTWGSLRKTINSQIMMKDVREMFHYGFHITLYMFHGGTNFGFIGGAQYLNGYHSAATNYDYNGLLSDDGSYTPEYFLVQTFFQSVTEVPPIPKPKSMQTKAYLPVTSLQFMSLWDVLPHLQEKVKSHKPLSMERLPINNWNGQSFGYVVYEVNITTGGLLSSRDNIHDRALVFLNSKYLGVLDYSKKQLSFQMQEEDYFQLTMEPESKFLRLLVENQGRSAYGKEMNMEKKGLTGDIYLNKNPLRDFTIYSLDMKTTFIEKKLPSNWKPVLSKVPGPAFFLGILNIEDSPKDTFIKREGWKKGVMFINGHNLGRYWDKGPQETVYVPGCWLHPGTNEIIIFEEFKGNQDILFSAESNLVPGINPHYACQASAIPLSYPPAPEILLENPSPHFSNLCGPREQAVSSPLVTGQHTAYDIQ